MAQPTAQLLTTTYVALATALALLYALGGIAYANSYGQTITATVSVPCTFGVSLNAMSDADSVSGGMYALPLTANIPFMYSAASHGNCTISSLKGEFYVYGSNSTLLYSKQISGAPLTGNVYALYAYFPNATGNYTAKIRLTYENFTNGTSTQFHVVEPAILGISGLSVSPKIGTVGGLLTVSQYVNNTGFLAASNIIMHTGIRGPNSFNVVVNTSVGSMGFLSFSLKNVTGNPGIYSLSENLSYFNGVSNSVSRTVSTSYIVSRTRSSSGSPSPSSVTAPPNHISTLVLSSVPVVIGSSPGSSGLSALGFRNVGSIPMWVNITTPENTSFGKFRLSANSVYLPANQSMSIQMTTIENLNATPGTYVIPIMINTTQQNHAPVTETLYVMASITNISTAPGIAATSLVLENNGTEAQGELMVYNPLSKDIYNATVSIDIPEMASKTAADIAFSGYNYNITTRNGSYVATWLIPRVPPNQQVYIYYSINNVSDPTLLLNPITQFSVPSAPKSSLTVFNVNIPAFYANSTGKISVSSIYTGQEPENITFTLVPPQGIVVTSPVQTFMVPPNEEVNPAFGIAVTGVEGTYLLTLHMYGTGINQTYSVPLVVFPQQRNGNTNTTPPSTTGQLLSSIREYFGNGLYVFSTLGIIVAIATILIAARLLGRSRYKKSRAQRLVEIKRHIERGSGEEE